MTFAKGILLAVTLMVLLQASAYAATHYSLESAFENPVSLMRTGVDHMLYASLTFGSRSQLLAYVEYDPFVEGYGVLSVRKGDPVPGSFAGYSTSESSDATTWSYVGARKLGAVGLGLAVNHAAGAGYAVDTGFSLDLSALTLSLAVQKVQFGSDGLAVKGHTISGVEWRISEGLSLGVDVASSSDPTYRLSVAAGGKTVSARFYAMGEEDAPMDSGIEVGLRLGDVLLKVGYHLRSNGDGQVAGIGFGYSF